MNMIGVGVGIEHRVDAIDAGIQELLPKIRAGVYQKPRLLRLHEDRRPPPAVPRVRRVAFTTDIADQGHAERATAAKHRHLHRRAGSGTLATSATPPEGN